MKIRRMQQQTIKRILLSYRLGLSVLLSACSGSVFAANDWSDYRSAERVSPSSSHSNQAYRYSNYKGYADPYGTPLPTQTYPIRPSVNHPPYGVQKHDPHRQRSNGKYPRRTSYPVYPQHRGVTMIYQSQFPEQRAYQSQRYADVKGENARIESSTYTLISDWRRYGLPDPQVGMHWIFQNGRYIQMKNDR